MSQSNGPRLPVLETCIPDPNAFRTLVFRVDQLLTAARNSDGSVLEHRSAEAGLRRSGQGRAAPFLLRLFLLIPLLYRLAALSSHAPAQK
jgi:hypothetical protein